MRHAGLTVSNHALFDTIFDVFDVFFAFQISRCAWCATAHEVVRQKALRWKGRE